MNNPTIDDTLENSSPRFSPQVEAVLRQAGWYPSRVVPDSQLEQWMVLEWDTLPGFHFQTRMFSAAYHILREFGGLVIEQNGPGVTCCRERFKFDPLESIKLTEAYNWPFSEWAADGSLYPFGCFASGKTTDGAIAVDGRGRIVDQDYVILIGANIDEALENLIIGLMPKPLDRERWKEVEASQVFSMMRNRLGLK